MSERVCVIVNPASRRGHGAHRIPLVKQAFAAVGVHDVRITAAPRDEITVARRAIEEGVTTIVASGVFVPEHRFLPYPSALAGRYATEHTDEELYRAAIELGGTVTGEHGIGAARREFLELQRGKDAVDVMRSIKAALDPLGILNPGRVV